MGVAPPDARDHPLAPGDLLLDRQVEIRVRLPHAADVLLRTLDPYGMPAVVVDLGVLGRDELQPSSTAPVLTTSS